MDNPDIHELNITELRKQKRPLWMSDLGIDNYADILGGGGDIYRTGFRLLLPGLRGWSLEEERRNSSR